MTERSGSSNRKLSQSTKRAARPRDENGMREEAATTARLKAENTKLVRENRRLRKKLERYQVEDFVGPDDEEEIEAVDRDEKKPREKCPECESTDITEFATPQKVLKICKSCKHRW